MVYRVVRSDSQEWSTEQTDALFAEGFPRFILADQEVKKHIRTAQGRYPHLDVMLVETESGDPIAGGWGVPISWTGAVADLPSSFADVLRRSVEVADDAADTFVICGGVVHPGHKGTGLASQLVTELRNLATAHGFAQVIAPLRPTRKHLYPLAGIEEYARWQRSDGRPFDPWLRLHVRLGAEVVALAPVAQTMTGTVAEWAEWTGLELPASGDYVIPQGMSLLHVDLEADLGTYVEPNIWVRHA